MQCQYTLFVQEQLIQQLKPFTRNQGLL